MSTTPRFPSTRCLELSISTHVGFSSCFDSYACSRKIQECIAQMDPLGGKSVHCHALKSGGCFDLFCYNVLLNMYVKLDILKEAHKLFDEMLERNMVSFVTLIQGYCELGEFHEVESLFLRLHREGHELNQFVFTTVLKVFATMDLPELGFCVHACIYKLGHDSNAYVGAALIESYSLSGLVGDARKVFDGIFQKDIVVWTGMIACYADNSHSERSLELYSSMVASGFKPNNFTVTSLLKAAVLLPSLVLGRCIHGCALKTWYNFDPYVSGALLDMYAKCGDIKDACEVFEAIPCHDVILWSFMIARYAQSNLNDDAVVLFRRMLRASVVPNEFSYSSVLQACANMAEIKQGEQVHARVLKIGLASEIFVANALIDVYAKCRNIDSSMELFLALEDNRNDVTWNTMIVGFTQMGLGEEALRLFCEMRAAQVSETQVTFSSVLHACAAISAVDQACQIHCLISKSILKDDFVICNALIDTYAKCGSIRYARNVFDSMTYYDVVSWNSIISGYAMHGLGADALGLFDKMNETCFVPNEVTFVAVLAACGNVGLVNVGKSWFRSMFQSYGVEPCMEHYTCMVRLLGRAGQLIDAMKFIEEMPLDPTVTVWRSLLSSCLIHKNVEIGKMCADKVLQLDPHDDSAHTMLSNIYARAGRWSDVALVRRSMRSKGVRKEPGLSWIDYHGEIHSFSAGEIPHFDMRVINAMLEWLRLRIKKAGYVPDINVVLHDIDLEEKQRLVWLHSERLALAFALVKLRPGIPIRIFKNLRFCLDCHVAFKLVSEVVRREIVVRDINRFHHFQNGICSCGDYW